MRQGSRIAAIAVAASIIFDSSAAMAASAPPSAPQASPISWQTLSMLNTSGAIGFGGAAVVAQPAADVPPPPPPPGYGNGGIGTPPLPVLAIWLATVAAAVYILTRSHGHDRFLFPVSPA